MSKILIIEDDISITEIERDYLELNGFSVESIAGILAAEVGIVGNFILRDRPNDAIAGVCSPAAVKKMWRDLR